MAIQNYHNGRSSANTQRNDAHFYRTNRNDEVVEVSSENLGTVLTYGFEDETDGYPSYSDAEIASNYVDASHGRYCHCEHDGSLGVGFEIVSQPMTLAAHRAVKWGELFDKLVSDYDADSLDTCGLHIHVGRAGLGNDEDAQYKCIAKILELVERFQSELSCFARRRIATCDWCRPTGYGHSTSDSARAMLRKARGLQDRQGISVHDGRRYRAINLQNRNTIEFRIFKGSLNGVTFYATLALVDGLVRWCKQHTSTETHTVTWDGLLAWINDADVNTYWGTRRCYLNRYAN